MVAGTPCMSEISYPRSRPRTKPLLLRDPVPTSPPRNPIRALDVTFREDDSRVRDHHTAARNPALVRKIVFKLLGRGRPRRTSVRTRRKRAAWNDEYMFQLLDRSSSSLA